MTRKREVEVGWLRREAVVKREKFGRLDEFQTSRRVQVVDMERPQNADLRRDEEKEKKRKEAKQEEDAR
ncbi:hypothetical protein F9C07_1277 [Aspergillus flavus]|uniref:Uncharacterized protein n=1 Tax=Aspergillus flavus (strain ATCC 200026 / FGSC A1120 / IAM 13836 / NRRL 3357 / JCM 12722 / SRRC 167) TaxID=332952 RepID=A0A7U2MR13_ASPFN|nr:hypothetical protein F9C07_1277 [Aspergillus flavus]